MRLASPRDFPKVDFFKKLKTSMDESEPHKGPHVPDPTKLDTPENVAHFAYWLLARTSDADFQGQDWDIRDESLGERWIGGEGAWGEA
jgi:hypothetical protein